MNYLKLCETIANRFLINPYTIVLGLNGES